VSLCLEACGTWPSVTSTDIDSLGRLKMREWKMQLTHF